MANAFLLSCFLICISLTNCLSTLHNYNSYSQQSAKPKLITNINRMIITSNHTFNKYVRIQIKHMLYSDDTLLKHYIYGGL